jgi:hypothetical protein
MTKDRHADTNNFLKKLRRKDWKDRRVAAINRISEKKGWSCSENNPYFEQYTVIMNPNIKTKQQCKEECRKNGYK